MSRLTKTFAQINTSEVNVEKSSVTQLTNISTAVSINASAGVITTVSSTLAPDNVATFTVNNNKVDTDSIIVANICDFDGLGVPLIFVKDVAAGSFKIVIRNIHGVDSFNNVIKINFAVL
jgi:hypothetical protein